MVVYAERDRNTYAPPAYWKNYYYGAAYFRDLPNLRKGKITMKRNPYQVTVKEIYPLIFWRDCDNCKMQFRREQGFSVKVQTPPDQAFPVNEKKSYCSTCTPDKESALGLFKKQYWASISPDSLTKSEPSVKPTPPALRKWKI